MKKKVVKTILGIAFIALVAVSFFNIGKFTQKRENNKNNIENACNFVESIVDWNTDGKEISMMTEDGYEYYAYKTEEVYNK